MNCDQVFDVLTRGPFPTGDPSDIDVEDHLAGCDDCHRLAEALRPAVELFQEAIPADEVANLPGYWCEAESTYSGGFTVSTAQVSRPRTSLARRLHRGRRWITSHASHGPAHLVAAACVAVALVGVLWGVGMFGSKADEQASASDAPATLANQRGGAGGAIPHAVRMKLLARLNLPSVCMGEARAASEKTPAVGTEARGVLCCTDCHARGRIEVGDATVNVLAKSCTICHSRAG